MDAKAIKKVEASHLKKRPDIKVGDTVKLSMKIKEGDKERTQVFEGVVIAMKGSGMSKTITVRKISFGVGVERIIPLHSPTLEKVEIIKRGQVRRSKLYYMRDKVGKRALSVNKEQDIYLTELSEEEQKQVDSETETTDEKEPDGSEKENAEKAENADDETSDKKEE